MKVIVINSPIQVLILNNIHLDQLLLYDYRENICVVQVTKKNCIPNSAYVQYRHLIPRFVDDEILDYKSDGTSTTWVSLSNRSMIRSSRDEKKTTISDL